MMQLLILTMSSWNDKEKKLKPLICSEVIRQKLIGIAALTTKNMNSTMTVVQNKQMYKQC